LNLIGSLDRPDSGQVIIDGKNVFRMKDEQLAVFRRQKIGFIFQNYNLIPSLNVWENVVLPIGLDNRRVNTAFVEDLLKTIGLSDRKKALPSMLSGGQQQRVAIARAIAAEPAIILADEPTGNLDTKTELEVMSLLKKSVEKFGQTLIMITHDEGIAQTADHIVHLEDGRVI
jgi:putative ABC transport system ATP-binding protein